MKNSNKRFALKFTVTIILLIALIIVSIQESVATVTLKQNDIEENDISLPVSHKENYLLFDNILQNKYETLLTSNIDYNTIYETIEL